MKKLVVLLAFIIALTTSPAAGHAQGLGDFLGGMLNRNHPADSTDSTATSSSGLGDLLGGVAGALGLGQKELSIENLAGTWNYTAPAVNFKSDNLLLKAGGAAASAQVEQKLLPYYQKAGLTQLVLTIDTDSTFTMKAKRITAKGHLTYDIESGAMIFHFKALKSFNIGNMEGYIRLSGSDKMELTFDVSRLMTLLEKVGNLTGNSSVKAVSGLLNKYDGIRAGFDLKKTTEAKP